MKQKIPNTIRRGGVFHFKKRIPPELQEHTIFGGREFVQHSLKTADPDIALKKIGSALRYYDELVESAKKGLRRSTLSHGKRKTLKKLNQSMLREGVQRFLNRRHKTYTPEFDIELNKPGVTSNDPIIFGVKESDWFEWLDQVSGKITTDDRTNENLLNIIEQEGWEHLLDDPILTEFLLNEVQAAERSFIKKVLDMNSSGRHWTADALDEWHNTHASNYYTLRNAIEDYRRNNPSSVELHKKMLVAERAWDELIGQSAIQRINRSQIAKFIEALRKIPKNYGRFDRPLSEYLAKKLVVTADCLAPKTIKTNYVGALSTALTEATDHSLISSNPFAGMKVKGSTRKPESRRGFTIPELNSLVKQPVFCGSLSEIRRYDPGAFVQRDKYYWSPILALFTGLRAAEIANLKIADFKQLKVDNTPLFVLKVRGTKTENSDRIVPIHPMLIKLGFLKHIDQQTKLKSLFIFEDWTRREQRRNSSDRAIRNFNERIAPVIVESGSIPTFHCFRHTLKVEMMSNGLSSSIQNAVLGHAQIGMDSHYFRSDQEATIVSIAAPFFSSVKFQGLEIDHLFDPTKPATLNSLIQ